MNADRIIICERCRRVLTDHASRDRRLGRDCAVVLGVITPRAARTEREQIDSRERRARPQRVRALEPLPLFAAHNRAAVRAACAPIVTALIASAIATSPIARPRAQRDGSYAWEQIA